MSRSGKERSKHPGGVLGLGDAGSSITNRESGQSTGRSRETDQARRRRRMSEGADELTPSTEGAEHSGGHGATGIDMGAGGEGTDLE
jgi:hypothetical protein